MRFFTATRLIGRPSPARQELENDHSLNLQSRQGVVRPPPAGTKRRYGVSACSDGQREIYPRDG